MLFARLCTSSQLIVASSSVEGISTVGRDASDFAIVSPDSTEPMLSMRSVRAARDFSIAASGLRASNAAASAFAISCSLSAANLLEKWFSRLPLNSCSSAAAL